MLSLSYSACYDPYNTIFRIASILYCSDEQKQLTQTLFIGDFYLCFPSRLSDFKPPNSVKGMRGRVNRATRQERRAQHELLPNSNLIFERMQPIQKTALSSMMGEMMIQLTGTGDQQVASLRPERISAPLLGLISNYSAQHRDLFDVVAKDLPKISLFGKDGLRARTGLGEWEYDAV